MSLQIAQTEENLDELLASLGIDDAPVAAKPTVEVASVDGIDDLLGELDLEAAELPAEKQENVATPHCDVDDELNAIVEVLGTDESTDSIIEREGDGYAETASAEAVAAETGIESAEPEKPAKAEKVAKPKKERKEPVRKHYASKLERVKDKLGADLGEYTVLELADAALTGDALADKQAETLKAMGEIGTKAQARMTFLMEFASGRSEKLNKPAMIALKLLKEEGKITTGKAGNYMTAMTAADYKDGSAAAQGNNTILAMRSLKMILAGESGEILPNPNSLYLMKINAMLGL